MTYGEAVAAHEAAHAAAMRERQRVTIAAQVCQIGRLRAEVARSYGLATTPSSRSTS